MAKFKYRFETIKEIKETQEKKVQKELAIIDLDIDSKKKQIIELNKLLKKQREEKLQKKVIKGNDIHFYVKYENYLNGQVEIIKSYLLSKRTERDKKLAELVLKSKETKTFEKLKEHHLAEFIKEQDKLEQIEMDEIAVRNF